MLIQVWSVNAINWVDSGSLIPVSKFVSSISLALYISTSDSDELKFGLMIPSGLILTLCIFGCEDAAQQVLMSVCLSVRLQVEILSQCANLYSCRIF